MLQTKAFRVAWLRRYEGILRRHGDEAEADVLSTILQQCEPGETSITLEPEQQILAHECFVHACERYEIEVKAMFEREDKSVEESPPNKSMSMAEMHAELIRAASLPRAEEDINVHAKWKALKRDFGLDDSSTPYSEMYKIFRDNQPGGDSNDRDEASDRTNGDQLVGEPSKR